MTLRQLIGMAATGELKNLAVKDDTDAIIQHINLGMIELYKRFPLKMEEHMITLTTGTDMYKMPSDFMWIAAAYGEVEDANNNVVVMQLPINEEDNPFSINTVNWNTVQIPNAVDGVHVSIMYVAAPTYLTDADMDEELELPVQMVEALLHYVGYRAHTAMDANIQAENSTHYTRFEQSCKRVEDRGMFNGDDLDMTDRYSRVIWA